MTIKDELVQMMYVDALGKLPWGLIKTSRISSRVLEDPVYDLDRGVVSMSVQVILSRLPELSNARTYRITCKPGSTRRGG